MAAKDLFISYTKSDIDWARLVNDALTGAGFETVMQSVDFRPGESVVGNIDRALGESNHVLALVSEDYLKSKWCRLELEAALHADPERVKRRLIPILVRPCTLPPILATIGAIDLSACADEAASRARLLAEIAIEPSARPKARDESIRTADYSHLSFLEPPLRGGRDELFSVAFSRDGRWVAAGSLAKVFLWDRAHPERPNRALTGPRSYVYSVAFSADSRYLAGGSEDKSVRVWDLASGELLWRASSRGAAQRHADAVYSVAFSPDGRELASGGYDKKVKLWNVASGQQQVEQPSAMDGIGRVTSVAYSPDGTSVAVGSLDNVVRLWDLKTSEVHEFSEHASSVEAVAFSPDGTLLASCGLDKTVRIWDLATRTQLRCCRGHEYLVRSVAFSPDSATVASASWDKTLRIWNARTGQPMRALHSENSRPWHTDWIWSVAFAPEGFILASGGSDGQILLWRIADAQDAEKRPQVRASVA